MANPCGRNKTRHAKITHNFSTTITLYRETEKMNQWKIGFSLHSLIAR